MRPPSAPARGRSTLFAVVAYLREAICDIYQPLFDEAPAAGTSLKRADGSPHTFQAFVGGGTAQVG